MEQARLVNKSACEQCRICTDLCPRHLLGHSTSPHKMVRAMAFNSEADEGTAVSQTCCQCNLCEYFSCPAGINPKLANVYYMNLTRSKGIKFSSKKDVYKARTNREYRLIPSKRLIARLNIKRFDVLAPLIDYEFKPDLVGIHLASHVGKPAEAIVKVGQRVRAGEEIGKISENALGACVHASIDGIVEAILEDYILIRRYDNV